MITTDFVHGSPCWLDLGAPDVATAIGFYTSVFQWEPYDPMGGGEYVMFRKDGKTVAAVGGLDEGARSAWMIYYTADDPDATATAVEKAGGTVRGAPSDIPEVGRFAQFTDPQGGEFAVFADRGMGGFDTASAPDTFGWAELWTPDAAGARSFYGSVLGWEYTDFPLPGGGETYSIIAPAGAGDERMQGGLMQVGPDQLAATGGRADWHPVFMTADCDASAGRVTAAGGALFMGPEDAQGVGRLAVCADPSGAGFVLLTPPA